jgi:RimJ/RimL family protein N-acetyltransferase
VIETDRLTLRPYRPEDFAPYFAMVSDPAWDTPSGQPISREEAWRRLMSCAGYWALFGYGIFALIERATGQYVGETGLWDAHRDMGEGFDGYDEAGWSFVPRLHGRGYGFEAADAAHRWYAGTVRRSRTVCMINPANLPSVGLARKLGYREFREGLYKGRAVVMFERDGI